MPALWAACFTPPAHFGAQTQDANPKRGTRMKKTSDLKTKSNSRFSAKTRPFRPFWRRYWPLSTLWLVIVLTAATSGCNMPGRDAAGSSTPNVTQAFQTVQARLTEAALQTPQTSPTPASSNTPVSTGSPASPTLAPTTAVAPTTGPTSSTKLCDQAEAGSPIDVTIPDDTQMTPGQAFTKVWRLRNSGTCAWTKNYSIAVFSGDPMNAPDSVPLPKQIDPGQTVDISVDLVAPTAAGSYQGNWKVRNASGTWFGIGPGGSSPFWVRIVVAGTITPGTPTPATATPSTPYPVVTTQVVNPGVLVSGSNTLVVNDKLNLDTNLLNLGGEDITLTPNAQGRLLLTTLGNAGLAGFGSSEPSYTQCLAAGAGAAAVTMRNIPQGFYICYRTDQSFYGWMRVLSYNDTSGTLNLQINTWVNP